MKHKVKVTVIDKKLYPKSDGTRPVIFKIERIDMEG